MITVYDMATGEKLACRRVPSAAPDRQGLRGGCADLFGQPRLQEIETHRPALQMPPELADLDIAEVLARFE